jgi:uncharacterized protein
MPHPAMRNTLANLIGYLRRAAAGGLIFLVRAYQLLLSPLLVLVFGCRCRFEPSCSAYFIAAVQKYGPLRGAGKGLWRLCRCNPLCRGGYDPP